MDVLQIAQDFVSIVSIVEKQMRDNNKKNPSK